MRVRDIKVAFRLFSLYFFLFAVTYLLLLCLGTAVNYSAVRNERQRELQIRLNETTGLLDDMMGRLRVILNQIGGRDWIEKYAVGEPTGSDGQSPYELHQIHSSLKRQQLTFDGVELMGVYFKGLGLVIDQQGVYDSSEYFKSDLMLGGVYESQWHAWAEGRSNFSVAGLSGVKYQGRWVDGVTVYRTIPNNSIKGKGLVFLTASRRLFTDLLAPMEDAGVSCVLTDMDGQTIAFVGAFDPLALGTLNEEDSPYVLFSETTLSNSSWKLYVVDSGSSFSLLKSAAPFLSPFSVFSVLLLGIAAAALLTGMDMGRQERLRQSLPCRDGYAPPYEAAHRFLRDSLARLDGLKRKEASREPLVWEAKLLSLLGVLELPAPPPSAEFPGRLCLVAALCSPIHRTSSFLDRHRIAHEMQEALRPLFVQVDAVFDRDNHLALLLWMETVQQKTGYLEPVEQWLSERFQKVDGEERTVFYGVGDVALQPEETRQCWQIALQDLDYKMLTHGLPIPDAGEAEHTLPDAAFEIAALRLIQQEQWEKLREQISLSLSGAGVEIARLFHWKLYAIAIKLAGQTDPGIPPDSLRHAYSIDRLLSLLPGFSPRGGEARPEKTAYRQQIIPFIDAHYRESGLSLQSLMDQFQISFTMINRVVQEGRGMSFAEYVTHKRTQYARRLLKTTEKSVAELALSAGYTSSGTFIRSFKKHTGITPGEYRRQHRGKGDAL